MEVLQAISNRRSHRAYKKEQLAEDVLSAILKAGLQGTGSRGIFLLFRILSLYRKYMMRQQKTGRQIPEVHASGIRTFRCFIMHLQ